MPRSFKFFDAIILNCEKLVLHVQREYILLRFNFDLTGYQINIQLIVVTLPWVPIGVPTLPSVSALTLPTPTLPTLI